MSGPRAAGPLRAERKTRPIRREREKDRGRTGNEDSEQPRETQLKNNLIFITFRQGCCSSRGKTAQNRYGKVIRPRRTSLPPFWWDSSLMDRTLLSQMHINYRPNTLKTSGRHAGSAGRVTCPGLAGCFCHITLPFPYFSSLFTDHQRKGSFRYASHQL